MPAQVHIKMNVDDAQALQALLRTQQGFQGVKSSVAGAMTRGNQGARELSGNLEKTALTAGKAALAVAGIGGAFQAATTAAGIFMQHMDEVDRRRKRAAGIGIDRGEAYTKARVALGFGRTGSDGKPFTSDNLMDLLNTLSDEGNLRAKTAGVVAETLQASAGFDIAPDSAVRQVLAIAKERPGLADHPEAMRDLAFGMLQLQKQGMTEEQATAFGFRQFTAAATTQPEGFAKRILPLGLKFKALGGENQMFDFDDINKGTTMGAVFSQMITDPEGRITETNLVKGAGAVNQFLVEKLGRDSIKDKDIFEQIDFLNKVQGGKLAAEFFGSSYITDDPELQAIARESGRGHVPGEAKALISLQRILQTGSPEHQRWMRVLNEIGDDPDEIVRRQREETRRANRRAEVRPLVMQDQQMADEERAMASPAESLHAAMIEDILGDEKGVMFQTAESSADWRRRKLARARINMGWADSEQQLNIVEAAARQQQFQLLRKYAGLGPEVNNVMGHLEMASLERTLGIARANTAKGLAARERVEELVEDALAHPERFKGPDAKEHFTDIETLETRLDRMEENRGIWRETRDRENEVLKVEVVNQGGVAAPDGEALNGN